MAGSPARERLTAWCRRWSDEIGSLTEEEMRIAYFVRELPHLLLDRPMARSLLENIRTGRPFPDIRKAGFFDNEISLYVDSRRRFSLRLYFHAAGEYTIIHDHNAWGVSGVISGRLGVIRYRRDDGVSPVITQGDRNNAGNDAGGARLVQIDHQILPAGEVAVTRPLAPGIHQTGNPEAFPNVMLTVYGRPARRLYIQEYDPQSHRISRRYPPKLRKKMFAGQVLKTFDETRRI